MEQYIGVDLHKQFFQACAVNPIGERVWEMRFPRTEEGLALFRARCVGQTALAVEACGPTWPFVDAVQPTGARICVVDPRKTRLKAGFAAKTDRLDARRLADALRRDSVVSVYVPPPAIRELREVCRNRHPGDSAPAACRTDGAIVAPEWRGRCTHASLVQRARSRVARDSHAARGYVGPGRLHAKARRGCGGPLSKRPSTAFGGRTASDDGRGSSPSAKASVKARVAFDA
jgi:hypothetical protein